MRSIRSRATGLALVGALVFAAAACADDEPVVEPPPGQDTEGEAAPLDDDDATDATDATDGAEVEAIDIAFSPESVIVTVGSTVSWSNQDVVRHTVTSGDPGDPDGTFDEPLDAEGDTATVTFDETGTFVYYCVVHPNMTGEVVVE